jgi:hypothetical protein
VPNVRLITALLLTAAVALPATDRAWSQPAGKPKITSSTLQPAEIEVRRSVFSGNEARLGLLWAIDSNCKAGPLPDVRVRKAPRNGELEFREADGVIEFRKEHIRSHCNGKPATGVAVFYKSRAEFTGTESMQIEVDYKLGITRRFTVTVQVR